MARFLVLSCLLFALRFCAGEHTPLNYSARQPRALRASPTSAAFRDELHTAIVDSLRAGLEQRLEIVRKGLAPMWGSLPLNTHGRVSRRSLRYALHRYLMKAHGVSVVGLEPFASNGSDADAALLLKEAPAYVRTVMVHQDGKEGFSIEDAAAMVVMLEEFVRHSGQNLLKEVALFQGWDMAHPIGQRQLLRIVEQFFGELILGDAHEHIRKLRRGQISLADLTDEAESLSQLVGGQVRNFEYAQGKRASRASAATAWNPMKPLFSFEDAQEIASSLVMSLARFWESECDRTTNSLIKLDFAGNGRVWLTDFYAASQAGEWHFSESESYLKEIGALDLSSEHGPRLILANYMQGISNCLAHNEHFRICCTSECDGYLSEIEVASGSPSAPVDLVIAAVLKLTTSLQDDRPRLDASLISQLHRIAELHSGVVPIHGRLFAIFLHFVFPRECPYPHKSGTVNIVSAAAFGAASLASAEEIVRHADRADDLQGQLQMDQGPDDWRSQWSEEEEELLSSQMHLEAPWSFRAHTSHWGPVVVLATVVASMGFYFSGASKAEHTLLPTTSTKAHYV